MSYQEVLIMDTYDYGMRSEAFGWDYESGAHANKAMNKHGVRCEVGLIGNNMNWHAYSTPLHALGAGFKLLAPPSEFETEIDPSEKYAKEHNLKLGKQKMTCWTWYFTRDCDLLGIL